MQVLGNRVLVAQPEESSTTPGGIIIPASAQNKTNNKGIVLQVGELTEDKSAFKALEAGQMVLLQRWAGTELTIDERPCLIVPVDQVVAIL